MFTFSPDCLECLVPQADEDLFSQDAHDDSLPYSDAIFQEGLREIDDLLQEQGTHLRDIPGIPILLAEAAAAEPRKIRQEREKSERAAEAQYLEQNRGSLNADQQAAYDAVEAALYGQHLDPQVCTTQA